MHFLTKMACHLLLMTSYLVTIITITKGHKISKRPLRSPTDHVGLRRRPLTALACNLTLPKLHLATLNVSQNARYG